METVETLETEETVKTVDTFDTVETVETVEIEETEETVQTEDLKKYESLTHFFLYNFIRITVVLVTVVAASLEHVILYQIID